LRFQGIHDLQHFLVIQIIPVYIGVGHRERPAATDVEAEDFVHLGQEVLDGALRGGGHRHQDLTGAPALQELHRGPHSKAGGQAVVDDDGRLSRQLRVGPAAPQPLFPPAADRGGLGHLGGDLLLREGLPPEQFLIEDGFPLGVQGPETGLGGPGELDLAHDEQVQREGQTPGNLRGHRHAAGGNGKQVKLPAALGLEALRQQPAGVGPVLKDPETIS